MAPPALPGESSMKVAKGVGYKWGLPMGRPKGWVSESQQKRGPLRGDQVVGVKTRTWTIGDLLRVTADYLRQKGIESPRLCAEILLAHQLRTSRVKLYLDFERPLLEQEVSGYRSLIKRRLRREPVQYITGTQEFWSLGLKVDPRAMIPRPETELLVEQAVTLCRQEGFAVHDKLRILDLGTGCGALAIALARELDGVDIWASDISRGALELAQINAKRHAVEGRIQFIQSDMWKAFAHQGPGFHLVISNPPYIPSYEIQTLPPEVRDFEPRQALDGGDEGMSFVRQIIWDSPRYLRTGGWLLLEMDPDQTPKAITLMEKRQCFREMVRLKDHSHRYRVVMARISPPSSP